MGTWVSLLRAVNLGARNKVSMPVLRDRLAEAGFTDVRTHLQSGNVVATSPHRSEAGVAAAVNEVVREHFGLDVPVVVRTPEQLAGVVAANPFPEQSAAEPRLVAVVFHADPVQDPEGLVAFARQTGDEVVVEGRDVYVAYQSRTGVHASRLTPAVLRRYAGSDGTARNWRTVSALAELSALRAGRRP